MFLLAILVTLGLYAGVISGDVDWRDENMSAIGDQGSCGGCVAFAIAGALDWQVATLTGISTPISTQHLVDCGLDMDTGDQENGCDGGTLNKELQQIMSEQYVPYAEDYPYQSNFHATRCEDMGARDQDLRNALADVWVHGYTSLSVTPSAIQAALQTGPTIHGMYIGDKLAMWVSSSILTDDGGTGCTASPTAHAMTFVGWQSNNGDPYYIVRNSHGTGFGDGGYVNYADNMENEACRYTYQAYQLTLGKRREIEYQLGSGRKTFKNARGWCQDLGDGWDLAHIPTRMHNYQVYDMFTAKYGSDEKADSSFNFYWIGLYNTRTGTGDSTDQWIWVDGEWNVANKDITGEETLYENFKTQIQKSRFAAVDKVHPGFDSQRGKWMDKAASNEYRFVCSRYRKEECPRISHRSVENGKQVTFLTPGEAVETLEIVDGTVATVECMAGYTLMGGAAVCAGGQWTQLPSCV